MFVGDIRSPKAIPREDTELRLTAQPNGDAYTVRLRARSLGGTELGTVAKGAVQPAQVVGNIALVCNFGRAQTAAAAATAREGSGKFWFADWSISGTKVEEHPDRAFGPILFSQYTRFPYTVRSEANELRRYGVEPIRLSLVGYRVDYLSRAIGNGAETVSPSRVFPGARIEPS